MKKVGAYVLLVKNTINKTTWKNYHFDEYYEQINLILAVLLFIMEESLKNEPCTIDDIAVFIDEINTRSFKKPLSYKECLDLSDFVANTVLCDGGKTMYFKGFNFEENDYGDIHTSFLTNKIVYIDDTKRRVSYSLSDDGYNFVLSTLEIENNLSITVQEIIFKEHLKKAEYSKAVDDIKNMFNMLRIRIQSMNNDIQRMKDNVLNYSVDEYKSMLNDNIGSLDGIRTKLIYHRESVEENIKQLKERDTSIKKLDEKESENLMHLSIISKYLRDSLEEQQNLLNAHFDFKTMYSRQLEEMTTMSIIKRYNIKTDLYENILKDSSKLENLDYILRPLFTSNIDKTYNINKCLQYQRKISNESVEEDEELSFEAKDYEVEKEKKAKEKFKKYEMSLKTILKFLSEDKTIYLHEIAEYSNKNEDIKIKLIPNIEIFREVVIELLNSKEINIEELKVERKNSIADNAKYEFVLNEMILDLIENNIEFNFIKSLKIKRNTDDTKVKFYDVNNNGSTIKVLNCSDINFQCNS